MREAIYYCPNNYSSDDDDELVSIVAVSIFAVRSRNGHNLVAWTSSPHLNVLITHAGRPGGSVGMITSKPFLKLGREFESRCRKKKKTSYIPSRLYAQELEND